MQEDLAALKKGQPPAGFQIEKRSEKEVKPAETAVPEPVPQLQVSPHVELGRLEKSKPLAGARVPSLPSLKISGQQPIGQQPSVPGFAKPAINIPSVAGLLSRLGGLGSRKLLWGGIGLLVIIVLAVIFVFLRGPSEPEVTVSPTPTATRTPTPPATSFIEGVFSLYSTVNLGVGPDVFGQLLSSINKEVLVGGEPGLYKIVDPQTGQNYSFNSFMSSALITVPAEIKPFINQSGIYLSLAQKAAGGYSYGFVVKLETDLGISQALSRWEANVSANLKDLFGLDIVGAASINFLDNTYQGVGIRYRNFPDPLKTIDYAAVTATSGEKYLVFVNSREHIYRIIDNLK